MPKVGYRPVKCPVLGPGSAVSFVLAPTKMNTMINMLNYMNCY